MGRQLLFTIPVYNSLYLLSFGLINFDFFHKKAMESLAHYYTIYFFFRMLIVSPPSLSLLCMFSFSLSCLLLIDVTFTFSGST